jgi:cellulose synthase/poly-beta-1,6-N-acetylglucosamine synthase-like glycosyltransferase
MVIADYIFIFLVAVLATYYSFTLIQFFSFWGIKKRTSAELLAYPQVSVLVAARNEEEHILRCLGALRKQTYPLAKIQVIVGDDGSDDETAREVLQFKASYPELDLQLMLITKQLEHLQGKANVLAHLFHEVKGEFVFITDADVAVSPDWIRGLLNVMQSEPVEVASGSTFVSSDHIFGTFQSLEWIEAFGLLHAADYYHIPVTAVGNNMVVSKKAYDAVGGYENIPFSVTEDLDLYLALQKNHAAHKQVLQAQVIAWTKPIGSFLSLLKQRKRWLKGVERTPLVSRLYMGVHALMGLLILMIGFYDVSLGLTIYVFSCLVHVARIRFITQRVEVPFKKQWMIYVLFLDAYQLVTSVSILVYYLLPVGVEWKKRVY